MVLLFVQSGLAFLALLPIVYVGICLLDAFLMDSSRIAQHCSIDLSLKCSFQFLEVIIYLISLSFPLSYLYLSTLDLVDLV